jgi:hypothetical protein
MKSRVSLAVAAASAAAMVFALVSLRARAKPDAARTLRESDERNGRVAARFGGGMPAGYDEGLITWIPIVVPLSAVVLTVGIYLIYAAVL